MKRRYLTVILTATAIMTVTGNQALAAEGRYVPGLGEFMSAQQMRHSKLWFAGQAQNWPLAAYELDEIKEGFGNIVKYHPVHEGAPIPIKNILPDLTNGPLALLQTAVASEKLEKFDRAFDSLTKACNECHRAEKFGFNVITRPKANPYTNQDFLPAHLIQPSRDQKTGK